MLRGTLWLGVWCFVGCPAPTEPLPTVTPTALPTDTASPTPVEPTPPPPEQALALPPTAPVETTWFATADACASCHSNTPTSDAMRDDTGEGVAPYDLWQSSMMANAARDPIWRAVVSAEIAATPGAAAVIGERCMNCHAPMAWSQSVLGSTPAPTIDVLDEGTTISNLALDGVSCTLCHQIEPDGLGQESSWKGNYTVTGARNIYGPHASPATAAMSAAGWTPVAGSHINDAGLCASCHMLITDALNPDGTPNGGSVVEQAPFLEMQNSQHATSRCQSCHFPSRTDVEGFIDTRIARNADGTDDPSLPDRSMGRHVIVGGNTLVPQLFRDNPELLNATAPPEAFDATIASARSQLAYRTAFLSITDPVRTGDTLTFTTDITVQAGHKFPTGIPLRRAWLRVQVSDANGTTFFLSGAYDDDGRILVDGEPAPFERAGAPLEPHHTAITDDAQVQVYEAVLADLAGDPTFLLLRGAGFAKDNRLLPAGWSNANMNIDLIRPVGTDADPDYTSGGDTVAWTVDVAGGTPPFQINADLYYQTLSSRFAEELWLADTPETNGLKALLQTADRRPDLVSRSVIAVQ
jgi:hypothetical protein